MRYRLSDLKHFFIVAIVNAHINIQKNKRSHTCTYKMYISVRFSYTQTRIHVFLGILYSKVIKLDRKYFTGDLLPRRI